MDSKQKFNFIYVIIAMLGILLLQELWTQQQTVAVVPYSELEQQLKQGKVAALTIREQQIYGELTVPDEQGKKVIVANRVDPNLAESLTKYNVPYTQVHESKFFSTLLSWIVPVLVFFGIWFFVFRKFIEKQGAGGGFQAIGKSKAKVYMEKETGVTFDDVAGVDECKNELIEIVEFLKSPEEYSRLGARMPKGCSSCRSARNRQNTVSQGCSG